MKEQTQRVIADTLVIGFGVILLHNFIQIWREGRVLIQEPREPVLALETALAIAITAFGVGRFIKDLKG